MTTEMFPEFSYSAEKLIGSAKLNSNILWTSLHATPGYSHREYGSGSEESSTCEVLKITTTQQQNPLLVQCRTDMQISQILQL